MSVYFIQAGEGGPVKIGLTTDLRSRFIKMQVDNHERLRVLGVMEGGAPEEAALHLRFADHHQRGEWFWPAPELLALASSFPVPFWVAETALSPMAYIRRNVFNATQAQFAADLNIHQSTVSRWERDELSPSGGELMTIRSLAKERGLAWDDSWFFEVPARSAASLSTSSAVMSPIRFMP